MVVGAFIANPVCSPLEPMDYSSQDVDVNVVNILTCVADLICCLLSSRINLGYK